MLRKTFTIALFAVLTITTANAAIRRVGFTATNPVSGVDYTSLQAAHDAAAIGDTIQIYPTNPGTTWTCTMTKRLNLFGTGYLTDGGYNANTGLQNITGQCSVNLTLDAGASGSLFTGIGTAKMTENAQFTVDGLTIGIVQFSSVNNIIIKRCIVNSVTLANYAPNDSWTFSQCRFHPPTYNYDDISCYLINPNIPTVGGNAVTNLRVENCLFTDNTQRVNLSNAANTGNTGQIVNCIFYRSDPSYHSNFNNASFLIQNNIYVNGNNDVGTSNCIFQNNITASPQSGNTMNIASSSGNKYGVIFGTAGGNTNNFNTVFVGYPYNVDNSNNTVFSEDAKWQLKASSAASGANTTGGDCGAFGGPNKYKLAGIPTAPAFYKLTAPSNTTGVGPYTITFSVRSNN